jgi:hypothetical protein
MSKEQVPGKPTSRRYSPQEKAAAVRMVRALRWAPSTGRCTGWPASLDLALNRCGPGRGAVRGGGESHRMMLWSGRLRRSSIGRRGLGAANASRSRPAELVPRVTPMCA